MHREAKALRAAIRRGDREAVKAWLTRQAWQVNDIRDEEGRTPLHWAGSGDDPVIPCLLAEVGADPYQRDNAGLLPMDYPPGERETEGRRALVGLHRDRQGTLNGLLNWPDLDVPELLSRHPFLARLRRVEDGRTVLMLACAAGNVKVVRALLRAGAAASDVDWVEQRDAIFVSIEAGQPGCLKVLLQADMALRDRPHHYVVDAVPALLQPLHLAAGFGELECVKVLLAAGASVNSRAGGDGHVWTALHLATQEGHIAVVRRLLAEGADASLADGRRGFNALQWAMQEGQAEAVTAIKAWEKKRKVDLLRPFYQDTNETVLRFPLYHAPLRLPAGCCTVCKQKAPYCLQVSYLMGTCPSCGQPRDYRIDDAGKVTRCHNCGRSGNWPERWPREPKKITVCYECLRRGLAGVNHMTELGLVCAPHAIRGTILAHGGRDAPAAAKHGLKTRLIVTDDGNNMLGIHVPQKLLDELMRTPKHPALQNEYWPFCCGGWMHYLGSWRQQDFDRRDPGRAFEWFKKHLNCPEMAEDYWDWLESETGRSSVYACPRCGLHKVYVDSD